ncbi:DUF2325 domain-containing protein [Desulfofundulus sp.]|uniref:DUF2325 domain-containing protein n=1 Tax=Desulfofundulus sp. TaxID=2282750 RepID=UPI003C720B7C
MSVFIVGGDRLGKIPHNLFRLGFDGVYHFRGRKNTAAGKLNIPKEAGLVIVLTDYVSHTIATLIKEEARKKNIPVVYAKRTWGHIHRKLGLNQVVTENVKL